LLHKIHSSESSILVGVGVKVMEAVALAGIRVGVAVEPLRLLASASAF
jgi:hypothetical protein